MDNRAFDRLAAALGAAASRRAGVLAALGIVFGRDAAPRLAAAKPGNAGNCGAGRKKNLCKADADCCRGYCERNLDNKDGLGRCRCVRRNGACGQDNDCCSYRDQQLVCLGGICSRPCIGLGEACELGGVSCCTGSCPTGGAGWERGFAQVCCIPAEGSGCAENADCCQNDGELACSDGVCVHLD